MKKVEKRAPAPSQVKPLTAAELDSVAGGWGNIRTF